MDATPRRLHNREAISLERWSEFPEVSRERGFSFADALQGVASDRRSRRHKRPGALPFRAHAQWIRKLAKETLGRWPPMRPIAPLDNTVRLEIGGLSGTSAEVAERTGTVCRFQSIPVRRTE